MADTYISFYLRANRLHVFVYALRQIGSPRRICFLVSKTGTSMVMVPHKKKDFISHAVPNDVYTGVDSLEICSKKLCEVIAGLHGWDLGNSYRVPGTIKEEQELVLFDLTRAEIIEKE